MQNWPQYFVLGMGIFALGINLGHLSYGKKTGGDFLTDIITQTISLFVLWRGGFFAPIGWPA